LVRPSASILADNDYPRNRDCFDTNGALVLGAECVIVWSEEDDEDFGGPRSAFGLDDDDECESSGSTGEIENGIDDGIDTLCSVWTSSCSSELGDHCVDDFSSNIWDDVLEAFEERFDRSNQCSGSTTRRTSFQATFDFVSGEDLDSTFEAPTSLGGTGGGLLAAEVYVPRDCFSPRTALLPVVMENSNNNGDGRQRVLGFTVVFITGCFDRDSNTSGSTSLGSISGPDDGLCNVDFDDDDIEVRGVPLRVMFELESTAGLCPLRVSSTTAPCPASSGSASNIVNAALTIQTTR
jgi:hypothetical protein